ncbi:DNA/RNA helicase domain-containing protein [Paenibacillus sp. FSL R7-0312]|uniref:DNA/RNA helicase domain-containing protein n=1 Tax=Paenibacillus sp. FSL R7-0312 TaxID=2921682 RepID=UPI0030F9E38B
MDNSKAGEKHECKSSDRMADQIIRNTYRTLMTRGAKGCYIYCVDPHLKAYLQRRLAIQSSVVISG